MNTDQELAALAARQYGIVARQQLAFGQDAIDYRCRHARLHRVHAGVYAVGHLGLGREARWLAAVLACGEGAVLSHRSAAALWGIRLGELFRPEVTAPTSSATWVSPATAAGSRRPTAPRTSASR